MSENQATTATETEIEIPIDVDMSAVEPQAPATKASTPVRDAFNRGVLGRELPNVPIPADPDGEPAPVPLRHESTAIDLGREASAGLDEARAIAARIAAVDGEASDRLLAAADPVFDKLDAILTEIDRAKVDLANAEAEASSRYRDLPGIDDFTRKKVADSAKSKARDELIKDRAQKLDRLAVEAASLAAAFEKQIAFETRFADPELREALDGKRSPAEKSSEDWLTSQLESQPLSETSETYDLLLLGKDADRVRRFERASLSAVASIIARNEAALEAAVANRLSAEAKDRLSREQSAALDLRAKIRSQQNSRRPKSIEHGKQLLERLHSTWTRIAGFDARRGAGAVSASQITAMNSDDSKMAEARAQARSWKPMEKFYARHFRATK